jgi:hypothetical protein
MNNKNTETNIIKACLVTPRGLLGRNMPVHLEENGQAKGPDFTLTRKTHPPMRLIGECKTNIATRAQAYHVMLQTRAEGFPNVSGRHRCPVGADGRPGGARAHQVCRWRRRF